MRGDRMMRNPELSPIAVSARDAAELLGAAPSTVRFWCQTGVLPARKIGKGWVVRLEELDALTRTAAIEKEPAMAS
jgi:excisionase family DNA binding protein